MSSQPPTILAGNHRRPGRASAARTSAKRFTPFTPVKSAYSPAEARLSLPPSRTSPHYSTLRSVTIALCSLPASNISTAHHSAGMPRSTEKSRNHWNSRSIRFPVIILSQPRTRSRTRFVDRLRSKKNLFVCPISTFINVSMLIS